MPASNVLVVFWSRFGSTEKLALAAAVGAVQGRANIRLRWLREESWDPAVPGWRESRERMEAEYIQPRVIDIEWANAVVLVSSSGVGPDSPPWPAVLAQPGFSGKRVGLLWNGPATAWTSTLPLAATKTVLSDDFETATAFGKSLA